MDRTGKILIIVTNVDRYESVAADASSIVRIGQTADALDIVAANRE